MAKIVISSDFKATRHQNDQTENIDCKGNKGPGIISWILGEYAQGGDIVETPKGIFVISRGYEDDSTSTPPILLKG